MILLISYFRAFYYDSYRAEEELYRLGELAEPKLARDCVGTRVIGGLGRRCSFGELML